MKNSLKEIATKIDKLIAGDDFPATIKPDFLADAVRDYPSRGGKRLRPALAFWSSRMLGGDDDAVLYPAAAVEVFHNWTLVHDDIIDQDSFRRNEATSHYKIADFMRKNYHLEESEAVRNGRDFAMLCGDLQQSWANELILKSVDHGVKAEVAIAMQQRMQKLGGCGVISGEAIDMELALRSIEKIMPEEVEAMLRLKTGALLQLSAELGAMVALQCSDAKRDEVRLVGEFAMSAGVAFQLQDDWLGIFGDETKLGKAVGGDLRESKPTLLLLKSLEVANDAERSRLLSLLGRESYTAQELNLAREIMSSCGAEEYMRQRAKDLGDYALEILEQFPNNSGRQMLIKLVDFLINREL